MRSVSFLELPPDKTPSSRVKERRPGTAVVSPSESRDVLGSVLAVNSSGPRKEDDETQ